MHGGSTLHSSVWACLSHQLASCCGLHRHAVMAGTKRALISLSDKTDLDVLVKVRRQHSKQPSRPRLLVAHHR